MDLAFLCKISAQASQNLQNSEGKALPLSCGAWLFLHQNWFLQSLDLNFVTLLYDKLCMWAWHLIFLIFFLIIFSFLQIYTGQNPDNLFLGRLSVLNHLTSAESLCCKRSRTIWNFFFLLRSLKSQRAVVNFWGFFSVAGKKGWSMFWKLWKEQAPKAYIFPKMFLNYFKYFLWDNLAKQRHGKINHF